MESIFQSIGLDRRLPADAPADDAVMTYENIIKAMIEDAVDFNDSDLSPEREKALKYYHGLAPELSESTLVDGETGQMIVYGSDEDEDDANRSQAISSDLRDTVLAIMPSLIRIFTSGEHVVYFTPNTEDQVEIAKQQTDYIEKIFWDENDGFLLLHSVFKDALIQKIGVVKWWTEDQHVVKQRTFENISILALNNAIQQYNEMAQEASVSAEIIDMKPGLQEGILASATVKYIESMPKHCIEACPPEEFRIDRRAKSVPKARLVGHQTLVAPSVLVSRGYDYDMVMEYVGTFDHYTVEADIRNPGIDTSAFQQLLVEYGEYFIQVDQDGDGIDELHRICVIGNNYDIIDDEIVDEACFAVYSSDPEPHTVVGSSVADLVMDIQKINTQILRGSLDSLSRAMNPDIVFNEMTTNAADLMSDGVGRTIRTTGDPGNAFKEITYDFVGEEAFSMMSTMDMIRQRRTGISEASKGVDPKALQSTNQIGVEAIVSGAQERIELIARIFAETGFKDMFRGLLREVCRNPNKAKTVEIRGKWVEMNPSLFDPNLKVKVNPTMGKGSDTTRLMALTEIKNTQMMILDKFGIGNTVVTPNQLLNTVSDMMSIANIKDMARYFTPMQDEQIKMIQTAPKEPTPEDKIATAELEKVRAQTAKAISEKQGKEQQSILDEDFRRDKLALDTMAKLSTALAKVELPAIEASMPFIRGEDQVGQSS